MRRELPLPHTVPQQYVLRELGHLAPIPRRDVRPPADEISVLGLMTHSYDTHGVFSSPRALYMFRAFGHNRSSILDGGLPAWIAHGYPTNKGDPEPIHKTPYSVPELDDRVVKSKSYPLRRVEIYMNMLAYRL